MMTFLLSPLDFGVRADDSSYFSHGFHGLLNGRQSEKHRSINHVTQLLQLRGSATTTACFVTAENGLTGAAAAEQ